MTEVVAHVIAAEGKHGHRIAANSAYRTCCCRGSFRSHCCSDVHSGAPIESLENEWHGGGSAAAKDNGADGNAAGIFPRGIDRRTLRSRCGEPRVWVRCLCARYFGNLRSPLLALPIEAFRGRSVRHALPPHATVRS